MKGKTRLTAADRHCQAGRQPFQDNPSGDWLPYFFGLGVLPTWPGGSAPGLGVFTNPGGVTGGLGVCVGFSVGLTAGTPCPGRAALVGEEIVAVGTATVEV